MKGQSSDTLLLLGVAAVLIAAAVFTGFIKLPSVSGGGGIPSPAGACINEGEPYYYACSNGVQIVSHVCKQGKWARTTTQCEVTLLPSVEPFAPTIPPSQLPSCGQGFVSRECNCGGVRVYGNAIGLVYCCNNVVKTRSCVPVTPTATPYYPTLQPSVVPTATPYACDKKLDDLCGTFGGCCVSGLRCDWVFPVMRCVKVGAISSPVPSGGCGGLRGTSCVTSLGNAGVYTEYLNQAGQTLCTCIVLGGQLGTNCNLGAGQTCQPVLNDKCCVGSCGLSANWWEAYKGFYCR